jgi:hypothetical protein
MSQSVSEPTRTAGPLLPPEEQFWQRYSPHGEFPLSSAASLALHVVPLVVLLLFGGWLAAHLFRPSRSVPVEPVRLGGGGGPKVKSDGPGVGDPDAREENVRPGNPDAAQQPDEPPKRPSLARPKFLKKVQQDFVPADRRWLRQNETDAVRGWVQLEDDVRAKLQQGLGAPSKGSGGPGSRGGLDKGKDGGTGPGSGPGRQATLTQREKRMLRWQMRFAANNGPEYLAQLRGLGAILAIPTEGRYKIVRDLRPVAALLDEDLSEIKRIYWIDDNPRSVRDVLAALGHPKLHPDRFVAFMPVELENKLFEMEKREMIRRKRHFNEDEIYETVFRVVRAGGGYEPVLSSITFKRGR